jgi:cell division topological specificity factor
MASFFDRMLGRNSKAGTGSVAKSRLQLVLVHDRINLPPERLRELKEELLAVIAKYITVDPDSVAIAVEQPDRNNSKLVAQIPFGKSTISLEGGINDYDEDDDLAGGVTLAESLDESDEKSEAPADEATASDPTTAEKSDDEVKE